jgi:microcystin-dependent protein
MATPFLSEIRVFSFNFPPKGWAFCDGSLMQISQNPSLFQLIGAMYGGDGQTSFGLPNLQSRTPIHAGNGYPMASLGGEATHTLTVDEMPQHLHTVVALDAAATIGSPNGAGLAQPVAQVGAVYAIGASKAKMNAQALANAGGSQPHNNLQPSLTLNFCIALSGEFPSQP